LVHSDLACLPVHQPTIERDLLLQQTRLNRLDRGQLLTGTESEVVLLLAFLRFESQFLQQLVVGLDLFDEKAVQFL
jgi:hypothetical protein